jgi:hypothetical protein
MGIQAFVPSGGGGTPGFDYIASIRMETYNRSWTQAGAAGNYVVASNLSNPGYAYFVGSTTTGTPLNKVVNVGHSFTRIDIIAPTGDFISLSKAAVKSTGLFSDPFAGFASFPSIITSSGNFVLPTSALPLVTALVVGGGGGGGAHHSGGGGGGGGIVKLTGYLAVGTTGVTIGGNGGSNRSGSNSSRAGTTYFGNVFANGGGSGGRGGTSGASAQGGNGANGGGAGGHHSNSLGGIADASSTVGIGGLGTQTGTAAFYGGFAGGPSHNGNNGSWTNRAGGGGGAGGVGGTGKPNNHSGGDEGAPYFDNISGSSYGYAAGGAGGSHSPDNSIGTHTHNGNYGNGGYGAHSESNNSSGGTQGVVIVRYYIA